MSFKPELIVVVDLGKSLIKAIYMIPAIGTVKVLFLEPGIAELSAVEVKGMQRTASAAPEDDAWLVLPDGQGLALGFLAQTRFASRCDTKEAKYKIVSGAARYLAAIGAIAWKENLNDYRGFASKGTQTDAKYLPIHATLLLPYVEISNASQLRAELSAGPIRFMFRGQDYTLLTGSDYFKLSILPEGAGQLTLRQGQLSEQEFGRRNILLLIMGQYNITAMLYQRGQCAKVESPAHGFHDLVNDVLNRTSLDASAIPNTVLVEAIYKGRSNPDQMRSLLIGRVEKEEHLNTLAAEIGQVVTEAFDAYWKSTANWLKTMLGPDLATLDEVLIGGGATTAFKEELEALFAGTKVIWGGGIKREISQTFGLKPFDPMVSRLVDAYGVFKQVRQIYQV